MLGLGSLVLIASALQISLAQPQLPPNIPSHCRGPPPGVEEPQKCCQIPSVFADEDLEACGIPKLGEKPQEGRLRGPPDCSKPKCLLEKYKLLKDDKIDNDAVTAFLDKWAENNPDFKTTVETAKGRCLGELPGPPQICPEVKFFFCVGSTMFMECPKWEDTENCKKLKDHIESCQAAAPKPF